MGEHADSLELPDLGQHTGSLFLYKFPTYLSTVKYTEGVKYIMDNGYTWFVTDMAVYIHQHLSTEEFICIKLKVNTEDNLGMITLTDGNDKVFYNKVIEYTDAKKDLTLFLTNEVLMLSGEY